MTLCCSQADRPPVSNLPGHRFNSSSNWFSSLPPTKCHDTTPHYTMTPSAFIHTYTHTCIHTYIHTYIFTFRKSKMSDVLYKVGNIYSYGTCVFYTYIICCLKYLSALDVNLLGDLFAIMILSHTTKYAIWTVSNRHWVVCNKNIQQIS
jgi:hypothetical protein